MKGVLGVLQDLFSRFMAFLTRAANEEDEGAVVEGVDKKKKDKTNDLAGTRYYLALSMWDQTIVSATEALRHHPHMREAYLSRGWSYSQKHEYVRAVEDFTMCLTLSTQDAKAHFLRAQCYEILGKYELSFADFDAAIRLEEQHLPREVVVTVYGPSLYFNETHRDTINSFRLQPGSLALAYSQRAERRRRHGDYELAIDDYTKAIQLDSSNSQALEARAECLKAKGDYEEAAADYTRVLQIDPAYPNAYLNRGVIYGHLKDIEKSIEDATNAIRLRPNHVLAYRNRAISYHNLGQFDQALADCNTALRLDSRDAKSYFQRGLAYGSKELYDLSIADYSEAISLDPTFGKAYNNRAIAYGHLEDYNSAIADYTEAIRIDPTWGIPWSNRSNIYNEKGDYELALRDANEALRLNPQHGAAYANRGWAYLNLGQETLALPDLNEGLRLKPELADAYIWRGIVYQDYRQEYGQALTDYEQALATTGEHKLMAKERRLAEERRQQVIDLLSNQKE